MGKLHLESAEIGGTGPASFHFSIGQFDGGAARLELGIPLLTTDGGVPDIGRTFAAARAELVTTLLHALIEANRMDDSLAPRQEQAAPYSDAMVDLCQLAPANDDHRPHDIRAGGTS